MFYTIMLFANIGFGLVSLAQGDYGPAIMSLGVAGLMTFVGITTRSI
jgi:hypothetical protein